MLTSRPEARKPSKLKCSNRLILWCAMIWSKRPYLSFASYSAVHHSPLPLFSSAHKICRKSWNSFTILCLSNESDDSKDNEKCLTEWVDGRRRWISSKESMRFRKSASCSLEQLSKVKRLTFFAENARNAIDKRWTHKTNWNNHSTKWNGNKIQGSFW